MSPSDNEVDSVAIIDVLKNFIAEQEQNNQIILHGPIFLEFKSKIKFGDQLNNL